MVKFCSRVTTVRRPQHRDSDSDPAAWAESAANERPGQLQLVSVWKSRMTESA